MGLHKVSGVLSGDRAILWHKSLSAKFGRCGALLIQQVHFWCVTHPNGRDGEAWCYNTYEAWAEQTGYSTRQVKRVVKELEDAKVLIVGCFNKHGYDRTRWYRVDHSVLTSRLTHSAKMSLSIVPKCHYATGQNVTNNTRDEDRDEHTL